MCKWIDLYVLYNDFFFAYKDEEIGS